MNLPKEYIKSMKEILKYETADFLKCYEDYAYKAIRINTLKCDQQKIENLLPFKLKKNKFSEHSFYIPSNEKDIGNNPLHHAGAYYVQEPSASSAVSALDPQEGDKVLDVCAAPGGKSTQIAALLNGTGLVWCNEYVQNRAKILLSNVERMGIRNAVVSSCHPTILCSKLKGFFDKVLVDAPCSGEGMFRKHPDSINEWSMEHVRACAIRQLSILNDAANAVKDGGTLVYSTCTFSKEENEMVISKFLEENNDFEIVDINEEFGRNGIIIAGNINLAKAKRIFPMDGGEGHFVAKLRRTSYNECNVKNYKYNGMSLSDQNLIDEFLGNIFSIKPYGVIQRINDLIFILPNQLPDIYGLGVIRAGLLLGELKKSRIEPSHALFMSARKYELNSGVDLELGSEQIKKFLKGEEIEVDNSLSGFTAVMVEGISVGYGKCSQGRLKNKYPKGLRLLK